ncbi:MAG: triose-phosphate isomerase [Gammaproteobacteria bacterium]
MRKVFVAGNWKMNGDRQSIARLLDGFAARVAASPGIDVAVFPPFVYVPAVGERLAGTGIGLGAQDLSEQASGAFTGEVSGAMLRDCGCQYVIVGHSERRRLHDESDAIVAAKCRAAFAAGLTPVVCVGEILEERDAGTTLAVVERQVAALFDGVAPSSLAGVVLAYEPVWAIGTGRTATPAQAQEVHGHVRGLLAARDAALGAGTRILYGGSVTADNAADLFAMADVDGALVGGASLKADQFAAICAAGARRR